MAHYKILSSSLQPDDSLNVHYAAYTVVTGGTNAVGVLWTQAVVEFVNFRTRRTGSGTLAASPVDAPTQAALDAGTLYEWRANKIVAAGRTGPQARSDIESDIAAREPAIIVEMADLLRYWGFEGDTP